MTPPHSQSPIIDAAAPRRVFIDIPELLSHLPERPIHPSPIHRKVEPRCPNNRLGCARSQRKKAKMPDIIMMGYLLIALGYLVLAIAH
jgi:hypothetical protein